VAPRAGSGKAGAKLCPLMLDLLKALAKQPWWLIVLIVGAILIVTPSVSIDRSDSGSTFSTHPPTTLVPVGAGVFLMAVSIVGVWLTFRQSSPPAAGAGLDLSRVHERDGALCTTVAGCEVRVVNGRIEHHAHHGAVVVLPCNEYFDDRCVDDTSSALGAYANTKFASQVPAFVALMKGEAARRFGAGIEQRKTRDELGVSFGTGQCLLLQKPLDRSTHVAMISTTTQRADEGLSSRISYLFEGMRALVAQLADARVTDVVMPLLGSGHGHIEKPLALVGLLLAIAEVAHYGQGSQRLRRVTVVVFQADDKSPPEVDRLVVQRALALIGSPV